jgi:hypothetical protein
MECLKSFTFVGHQFGQVCPKRLPNAWHGNVSCPKRALGKLSLSGVSCGKQWTKIKAACVTFHACGERIRRMELTWAPTKDDVARRVLASYTLGAGVTSRLYDVIRAKSYPVDRNSRHIIQMEPRMCSYQPSFRSSWKHSALVETDPLLPWVPRILWNRGCGPGTLILGSNRFRVSTEGSRVVTGTMHC